MGLGAIAPTPQPLAIATLVSIPIGAKAQDRSLWLYNGQSTSIEGYFLEGEYIYGDCDQDCFDLDLFLYDAVLNSCLISSLPPTQSLVSANCLHQQTKLTCRKLRIEDSVILKLT